MRHSIKMLLAVLLTVMSFSAVQTVWAQEDIWPVVSGEIVGIQEEISTITIDDGGGEIVIAGFPFGYLERELGIEIMIGDCVTVYYAVVLCKCDEMVYKNIAIALTGYCKECPGSMAGIVESCSVDSIVLRDDDFYPVDKSRNDDDDDHYHHQNRPGNGS